MPEIVEKQLLRWRALRESPVRVISSDRPHPDVVAISREIGGDERNIARGVAELLGLPLYDNEIVEHIAKTARVHLETIQTLDEQAQGRVEEYLSGLLRERNLDRSDYMVLLARTVVSIWEHGPCVLMGHGAVHIVPKEHALKVRIFAPLALRVARLMERDQVTRRRDAERMLARIDAEQAAFHRRYFDEDPNDPHHYDLTVDCGRLGAEGCIRLIAEAYRLRFVSPRAGK